MEDAWGGCREIVVVPTFNERENLDPLVRKLLAMPALSVLVVDDASPDGTGDLADELAASTGRVRVLHRPGKLGLGSAYRDGFRLALKETKAELICEMDADLSHDPDDLAKMCRLAGDGADVVVGSRYVPDGGVREWARGRLLLSRAANFYARTLTRLPQRDATAGFKVFRRRVLETIDLDRIKSDGYAFQIEMSYVAWKHGFSIREMPIRFTGRRHGRSKLDRSIVFEAALLPWKLPWRRL